MNKMFKNNKQIISFKQEPSGRKTRYIIYEDNSEEKFKDVGKIKIKCSECENISERLIKLKYFSEPLLCWSCLTKGKRNPFYNKHHSKELKNKLSYERKGKWYVGKNNSMFNKSYYDIWLEKYGEEEANRRQKIRNQKQSKNISGENNPFYNKNHSKNVKQIISEKNKIKWKDKKFKKKQSKKFSEGQKNSFKENPGKYKEIKRRAAFISNTKQKKYVKTKPEIIFENILNENDIKNIYSPIIDKYQYDFKIKNKRILIEVDGDYWHGNPKFYDKLNHIQTDKQKRDKEKEENAKKYNFKLYRIWESDLNNKQKIKELINEIKTNNKD